MICIRIFDCLISPLNSLEKFMIKIAKLMTTLFSTMALLYLSTPAIGQEDDETEIRTIVITATRTQTTLTEAPAAMSLITAEDLDLKAIVNVNEAVRQLPGVSLHARGVGGRQVLSIRGMESTQTLFMIDGRRTAGTDSLFGHSDFQYNWVPINAIERIEIVRGPLSSLYGSDALGGVVNIITKKTLKEWTGSLSTRYGSGVEDYNESYLSGSISGSVNDLVSVSLSASHNNQDKIALDADSQLSELEGKEAISAYGRVSITPSRSHRLIFDFSITDEDRAGDTNSRGGPPYYEESYDLDKRSYGANYEGVFDDFDIFAGYYYSELDQVNHRTMGVAPSSPQRLKNDGYLLHTVLPVSDFHRVVVGGDIRTETLVHPLLPEDGSITYTGIFAQDEWSLNDDLTVTFGVRYDDHENFGTEFSPRAYAVYHFDDQLSLKTGYGHGFRAPTLKESLEEYKFIGPHSFYGNPDVGPETSDNFEVGLVFENNKLRFSTTGFFNKVSDLIVSECLANCSARFGRIFTWVNVDETQTKGLESELNFDFSEVFNVSLSHTYMNAKNKISKRKLAERPDHTFQASVSWNIEKWGLNNIVRAEYMGSVVQYDSAENAIDVPGYTLWHFNGSWKATDLIKVNYGIKNISNLSLAEKSSDFGYAERGRTVYIGASLNF